MKVNCEAEVTRCSNGSLELVAKGGRAFQKVQPGSVVKVTLEVQEPEAPAEEAPAVPAPRAKASDKK